MSLGKDNKREAVMNSKAVRQSRQRRSGRELFRQWLRSFERTLTAATAPAK